MVRKKMFNNKNRNDMDNTNFWNNFTENKYRDVIRHNQAYVAFSVAKAEDILKHLGVETPDDVTYTMFVIGYNDRKIVCRHDRVEDAVIRFKESKKWKWADMFECNVQWSPAKIKFEKGDYIEEITNKGVWTDAGMSRVGWVNNGETLIPKEDYTGNAYVLDILDDRYKPFFKVVYCEKVKRL